MNEGSRVIRVEFKEPLKEEIKHFIETSKSGEKNNADAFIGARGVFIIKKLFESLKSNQIVQINEEEFTNQLKE